MAKTRLIVETSPVLGKMSGIGHNTLELIRHLYDSAGTETVDVVLAVPFDRVGELKKIAPQNCKIKKIPIPIVIYNLLGRFNMLPPLDIFLGKGVYLFPNYRNTRLIFSKSLTYIYDASFILFPEFVSPKNKRYLIKNINRWANRADQILTISKSAKKEICEHLHIADSKVTIVYCGVDTNIYKHQPNKEIQRVKNKYKISGDYLLYIGNIEPRKNLACLIKAHRQVADKHPGLKLVIVGGDGWQNEEINKEISRSQALDYPVIKPSAYVPNEDLPALYSGAMMLVHPALHEGFGISLLQAMACGTPVIAADNSSMPEVVGDAGLYVDAGSVDDISKKILIYYEDEKLRIKNIEKGLKRARLFSWDTSAKKILAMVEAGIGKESEMVG